MQWEFQKREKKGGNVYLVTVPKHFLNTGREMNILIHEVQRSQKATLRRIIIKLSKLQKKEF